MCFSLVNLSYVNLIVRSIKEPCVEERKSLSPLQLYILQFILPIKSWFENLITILHFIQLSFLKGNC